MNYMKGKIYISKCLHLHHFSFEELSWILVGGKIHYDFLLLSVLVTLNTPEYVGEIDWISVDVAHPYMSVSHCFSQEEESDNPKDIKISMVLLLISLSFSGSIRRKPCWNPLI